VPEHLRVLLIEDNPGAAELVQRMLETAESPGAAIRLECVDTLAKAVARLESGAFDAILVDLHLPDSRGLETLSSLKAHSGNAALVVLTASEDENLALDSLREGADEHLVKGDFSGTALVRRLRFLVERRRTMAPAVSAAPRSVVLGFCGVKGGTGTTTTALNIAATFAKQNLGTIAIELKPNYGTLSFQLKHSPAINLCSLCARGPDAMDAKTIGGALCSFPLGLRVLFGPQKPEEFRDMDPPTIVALIEAASEMAERVVIDLPPADSRMAPAAVHQCDLVVLVLERDAVSVHAANAFLRVLRSWGISQLVTGALIVNRVMALTPLPIADMTAQLGCNLYGVIPPAIDLCARANQAGSPIVFLEPESTFAGVLRDVVERLSDQPSLRALKPAN
jgi:Flp pilus assembly CpaE family ATPase